MKLGIEAFTFMRELRNLTIEKDKFCGACRRRLAFLRFLAAAREIEV